MVQGISKQYWYKVSQKNLNWLICDLNWLMLDLKWLIWGLNLLTWDLNWLNFTYMGLKLTYMGLILTYLVLKPTQSKTMKPQRSCSRGLKKFSIFVFGRTIVRLVVWRFSCTVLKLWKLTLTLFWQKFRESNVLFKLLKRWFHGIFTNES